LLLQKLSTINCMLLPVSIAMSSEQKLNNSLLIFCTYNLMESKLLIFLTLFLFLKILKIFQRFEHQYIESATSQMVLFNFISTFLIGLLDQICQLLFSTILFCNSFVLPNIRGHPNLFCKLIIVQKMVKTKLSLLLLHIWYIGVGLRKYK
jgi:hypothetical protein